MRLACSILLLPWTLFVVACGAPPASSAPPSSAPPSATSSAPPSATSAPASIRAVIHLPEVERDDVAHLFVTVHMEAEPWTITGCATGPSGGCEETARVVLSEADHAALEDLLAEVRAIPRCEPEGIFPGDRAYRLDIEGGPRPYEGHLPVDPTQLEARNQGPCRADARLAWWIASRFRSE
ncbi:MAG: hypothetical protein K1X94_24645 [Sandaracinaceae bacterium]|nr:hypothetical protein [Sandaracinaceae bacterium]